MPSMTGSEFFLLLCVCVFVLLSAVCFMEVISSYSHLHHNEAKHIWPIGDCIRYYIRFHCTFNRFLILTVRYPAVTKELMSTTSQPEILCVVYRIDYTQEYVGYALM